MNKWMLPTDINPDDLPVTTSIVGMHEDHFQGSAYSDTAGRCQGGYETTCIRGWPTSLAETHVQEVMLKEEAGACTI